MFQICRQAAQCNRQQNQTRLGPAATRDFAFISLPRHWLAKASLDVNLEDLQNRGADRGSPSHGLQNARSVGCRNALRTRQINFNSSLAFQRPCLIPSRCIVLC